MFKISFIEHVQCLTQIPCTITFAIICEKSKIKEAKNGTVKYFPIRFELLR